MATKAAHRAAIESFVERWTGRGDEKSDCQSFWIDLLQTLFGVENGSKYIEFEKRVSIEHTKFIDAYIPFTKVLIEQKSLDVNLSAPNRQSGDKTMTPYEQAKQYADWLPHSEHPRWIITCNFAEFRIYNTEKPTEPPAIIKLEDLPRSYKFLGILLENTPPTPPKPIPNIDHTLTAGEIVGSLYDAFHKQYVNPDSKEALHSLNVLCVRLVFCLYAEDTNIFEEDSFYKYMAACETGRMRQALIALFKVLDTPPEKRSPYEHDLNVFPYVNGGLFSDDIDIEIPAFTDEIRELLLTKASANFNWSGIDPTIFGAVFESTLNPETRRKGGMHYTSIPNIHKVIDPLFLDDLEKEFTDICKIPVRRTQKTKLMEFQKKLALLNFLDPACGSGNFLTETYLSLRRLENNVLRELSQGQISFGDENWSPIQVSISQFYGIEINDFAVTVAKTALWIAESQMMEETRNIVILNEDFLPLKTNACIVEGNALRMDWETVIPKNKLSYIMGNPPFVGGMKMNSEQKADIINVIGKETTGVGEMDYVAGWYYRTALFIQKSNIECAFVSTNSLVQGQQAVSVWYPLITKYGIKINFAYRTFRWDSKSKSKAQVHCVIIGFSLHDHREKQIINKDGTVQIVHQINSHLVAADNWFIRAVASPLCNVPEIKFGSMPRGKGFILSKEEKNTMVEQYRESQKFIRPFYMGSEFINGETRYCLWLVGANPSELRNIPPIMERIANIKKARLESPASATRKLANTPMLFAQIAQPETDYIAVPAVSTQKRTYIPLGFLSKDIIAGNKLYIIPNAEIYHFGVLTSNVHMAWMRIFSGRMKSDYSYSKDIVYNNFPWPNPTGAQKAKIEETARAILDARALYPDSSLADLYDELTMPEELRRAHRQNDIAVMEAYGFKKGTPEFSSESACVAALMKMYQKLTAAKE